MLDRPLARLCRTGWIALLLLGAAPALTHATTFLDLEHRTGADDLRGGNSAFVTIVLRDGTVLPKRSFVSGTAGLPGRVWRQQLVRFPENVNADRIAAFRIRHDGNPRSGHPVDTYDNWDLRSMRIVVLRPGSCTETFRSATGADVLHRFTGESRTIDLPAGKLRSVVCR
jgi:hypothetical protein